MVMLRMTMGLPEVMPRLTGEWVRDNNGAGVPRGTPHEDCSM